MIPGSVTPKDHAGTTRRFVFLDGLRGVAALAVLGHHLYTNSELQEPLSHVFPRWIAYLLTEGARGVQIFFVLSGFVIAYSCRNLWVTPRSAANFALRRQIRLDPAYWICLALAAVNLWGAVIVHPGAPVPAPTLGELLSNVFYLQGFFHHRDILLVAWTLRYEVQFYLVFIVLLCITQRLRQIPHLACLDGTIASVLLFSVWASLALRLHMGYSEPPLFIYNWYLFGLGALAWYSFNKQMRPAVFWATAAATLVCGIWMRYEQMIVGDATAVIIFVVGQAGLLSKWSGGRVIQYLGRTSYSLYLIHIEVAMRVLKIGIHLTGMAKAPAFVWFILGGAASFGAAHLLYIFVERPTMRVASRLKSKTHASTSTEMPPLTATLAVPQS